ncbi:AMED_5909 family protein [Amycolatopsis sp. lyj-84]|uniref:AMED_5909 family protein n=1 Tax=Amycolatopsis sp. lyj-84 TaxID=2789284 RepID=UPI003978298A
MSETKVSCGSDVPRTLSAARADMATRVPSVSDDSVQWVAYHRTNVKMFKAVANLDPGHRWECLAWAEFERRRVEGFTSRPEWRDVTTGPGSSGVVL